MKDIYADDVWLEVAPADKLVAFLESSLAAAVADRPRDPPAWGSAPTQSPSGSGSTEPASHLNPAADPDITAVNAAFALGLVERHDLVDDDHRIYDLAHAAAEDAPEIDVAAFTRRFRNLVRDPDSSEYRKALVDVTRAYATGGERAAD
jgi:hypothetical protein